MCAESAYTQGSAGGSPTPLPRLRRDSLRRRLLAEVASEPASEGSAGGSAYAASAASARQPSLAGLPSRSSPAKPASEGWWPGPESNQRHPHFQCGALPTELPGRDKNGTKIEYSTGITGLRARAQASVRIGSEPRGLRFSEEQQIQVGGRASCRRPRGDCSDVRQCRGDLAADDLHRHAVAEAIRGHAGGHFGLWPRRKVDHGQAAAWASATPQRSSRCRRAA